ncbi:hypothetical protein BaRGS_00018762 [Batillaria attramentaria]|uniref:Uncharacterized protein n=1 Tax=Batillaria attramentaria TaxID=370345 RepID=A0ABD0KTG5_9CAEN
MAESVLLAGDYPSSQLQSLETVYEDQFSGPEWQRIKAFEWNFQLFCEDPKRFSLEELCEKKWLLYKSFQSLHQAQSGLQNILLNLNKCELETNQQSATPEKDPEERASSTVVTTECKRRQTRSPQIANGRLKVKAEPPDQDLVESAVVRMPCNRTPTSVPQIKNGRLEQEPSDRDHEERAAFAVAIQGCESTPTCSPQIENSTLKQEPPETAAGSVVSTDCTKEQTCFPHFEKVRLKLGPTAEDLVEGAATAVVSTDRMRTQICSPQIENIKQEPPWEDSEETAADCERAQSCLPQIQNGNLKKEPLKGTAETSAAAVVRMAFKRTRSPLYQCSSLEKIPRLNSTSE